MTAEKVALAGRMDFDPERIAGGLSLPVEAVTTYFRDGRRCQPIALERIKASFGENGWRSDKIAGGALCLVDPAARRWDVRVFVDRLSFAPSHMKGKGRRFDLMGFANYVAALGGVFVMDAMRFERCPYWIVKARAIEAWMCSGQLGARAEIDREGLAELLEGFEP